MHRANQCRVKLAVAVIMGVSLLCCPSNGAAQDGGPTAPSAKRIYKKVGNRELAMFFSFPPGWKKGDKRPAVVFFFGGGWTSGSTDQFQPQAEYLAKRGMVCARADYRVKSRDDVTPIQCVEDARSAMRWVRSHAESLGIDPNRIAASGGSAGGHLAACVYFSQEVNATTDDPSVSPRPNAMVLYNPALDLLALDKQRRAKHAPTLSDDSLKSISPSRLMQGTTPPTLVLDGTNDFLYDQNRAFVEKGRKLGAPVEVYWAENASHGFFNRSPWLERTTRRVDEFFQSIGYLSREPSVALPTSRQRSRK